MNFSQTKRGGFVFAKGWMDYNRLYMHLSHMLNILLWSLTTVNIIANLSQTVFTYFRIKLKILAISYFLHLTRILKLKNSWHFLHFFWIFLNSLTNSLYYQKLYQLCTKKYNNLHFFFLEDLKKNLIFWCLKYFCWKIWQW